MNSIKKYFILVIAPVFLITSFSCEQNKKNYENRFPVQGWNILSHREEQAERVITRSLDYNINHLQLSHKIIMDLRHAKNPEVAAKVNRLTKKAHEAGIEEVCVWDHALYRLDYYPDKFRTGPNDLINLDNPEFWKWIKNDYRGMLDLVPEINGIILTFIETGAHVEDQYSEDKNYAVEVVNDGLQHTFDICMIMNDYHHKGPTGQFHWQEDVYRGLAYYNAVKLRDDNNYRIRFFPFFDFGGLKEDEKTEIWQTAMENKP